MKEGMHEGLYAAQSTEENILIFNHIYSMERIDIAVMTRAFNVM